MTFRHSYICFNKSEIISRLSEYKIPYKKQEELAKIIQRLATQRIINLIHEISEQYIKQEKEHNQIIQLVSNQKRLL